jgi:hypothetical protein
MGRAKSSDPFANVLGAGRGLQGEQARERRREQDEREQLASARAFAVAQTTARQQALAECAATLSYSAGGGELFWHEGRGQVAWTMVGIEGWEQGTSAEWEIEQAFAALDFVNIIEILAEGVSPFDASNSPEELEDGELDGGWYRLPHNATVQSGTFTDAYERRHDAAAAAADVLGHNQWRAGVGSSRVQSEHSAYITAWVRAGHEASYRAYLAAEAAY